MNRHLDGLTFDQDPPLRSSVDPDIGPIRRCMRSGLCCQTATCEAGLLNGALARGCTFLRGDAPGQYRCGLVEDHPETYAVPLSIGEGCCMPLGNIERYKLLGVQKRTARA